MKVLHIKLKVTITLFLFFVLTSSSSAQFKIGVGGFLGGGTIKGESTTVGVFTASVFIETNTVIFLDVTPRLSLIYAKDFDALLPNTKKPYLPYVQAVTLKGIISQYFKSKIFLEEGLGLLALNDRTFSDTNVWNYGTTLSLSGGWDLRDANLSGFKLGIGIEYGITFNKTLAQYSSFHFYLNYTI
jgi:hypothetical protein